MRETLPSVRYAIGLCLGLRVGEREERNEAGGSSPHDQHMCTCRCIVSLSGCLQLHEYRLCSSGRSHLIKFGSPFLFKEAFGLNKLSSAGLIIDI